MSFLIQKQTLDNIADAIHQKNEETAGYTPAQMVEKILAIETVKKSEGTFNVDAITRIVDTEISHGLGVIPSLVLIYPESHNPNYISMAVTVNRGDVYDDGYPSPYDHYPLYQLCVGTKDYYTSVPFYNLHGDDEQQDNRETFFIPFDPSTKATSLQYNQGRYKWIAYDLGLTQPEV